MPVKQTKAIKRRQEDMMWEPVSEQSHMIPIPLSYFDDEYNETPSEQPTCSTKIRKESPKEHEEHEKNLDELKILVSSSGCSA